MNRKHAMRSRHFRSRENLVRATGKEGRGAKGSKAQRELLSLSRGCLQSHPAANLGRDNVSRHSVSSRVGVNDDR